MNKCEGTLGNIKHEYDKNTARPVPKTSIWSRTKTPAYHVDCKNCDHIAVFGEHMLN